MSNEKEFKTHHYFIIRSLHAQTQARKTTDSKVTYTPRVAGLKQPSDINGRPVNEVNQAVQYFDGLGRPLQAVQTFAGPTMKDIVQPYAYDEFGRQAKNYLPYASSAGSYGNYKAAALTDVISYYSGSVPAQGLSVTFATPFSQTGFDGSPLNQVAEQGAPGNPWQPASSGISGSGHTVKIVYSSNGTTEVRKWTVVAGGASSGSSYYEANQLYKTITKDENWISGRAGTTEAFKDKEGRVVLNKVWETESKSLSTYYVYDDYGNLRYVLPPAVNENGQSPLSSFSESDAAFLNFIYGYHYDNRNQLTEKKIPGKGWEYLIYNKQGQVVATQDAVQRNSSQWLIIKYDALGRVVMSGLTTASRATAESGIAGQASPWETYTGSGTGYSQNCWPGSLSTVLSINYYDSYSFPGNTYGGPAGSQSSNVKGLPTGSKVNVLGTSTLLLTVNYYDTEGRVIQSKADNYIGGSDIVSNTYTFTGELKASTRQHTSSTASVTVATRYEYDHTGREKAVYENINNQGEVKLSGLNYTETGQLLSKKLHNNLQSTSYTYNERGWLKNSTSNQFSFQLNYQEGTTPQWNGNISNQLWGASAPNINTFTYTYDKLNRLLSGSASGMSESITYNEMGNITSLSRDGLAASTYHYQGNNSNQLDYISGPTLTTGSYAYDANGNTTTDGRNGTTINYNILNLPKSINNGSITYTYDATGRKLRKASSSGTTDYIDGIQYTNGTIDFIQTEEGRAFNNGGSYQYQYNLKDHLGNVRYSFDIYNGAVRKIQQDNYYAFGKRAAGNYPGSPDNKYLYNGKELQDELGQYDYGARFYDPVIGRWNVSDPMAEASASYSPYAYVANNPLRFIDPNGMYKVKADSSLFIDEPDEIASFMNYMNGNSGASINDAANYIFNSDDFMQQIDLPEVRVNASSSNWQNKFYNDVYAGYEAARPNNSFGGGVSVAGQGEGTPWMSFAKSQLGVTEATDHNDGADVNRYLATAGLANTGLPWCGCFVNWAVTSAGIKGPKGPAGALNWRNFGQSINKPAFGSIGTLKRPGGGHVGFTVALDADRPGWVIMLGGNQSDAVSYRSFPVSIMQFNYPTGFVPSYSLPSMNGIRKGVRMQ